MSESVPEQDLISLLRLLGDDNDEVYTKARSRLIELAKSDTGFEFLISHPTKNIINLVSSLETDVPFRVFSLFIDLANISKTHFEALKTADGFLGTIRTHIEGRDILLRLNAIDGIGALATISENGFDFAKEAGLIEELSRSINTSLDDEIDVDTNLVLVSSLKVIGSIFTKVDPKKFGSILSRLLTSFLYLLNDLVPKDIKEVTLRTIGSLGSSSSGIDSLFTNKELVKKYSSIIRTATGSTLVEGLRSLSFILEVKGQENEEKTRTIFNMSFESPAHSLMKYNAILFEDIRISSYAVTKGVVSHDWGVQLCADIPELLGDILNREKDASIIGKEWRYSIAQEVLNNPNTKNLFDPIIVSRLELYIKEGPFFVPSQPLIAMESSS